MYVITVIPISKGIGRETLSYFTMKDVSPGALVEVPLRKKIIPALVVARQSAADIKSDIKNASFEIKKVESVKVRDLVIPEFILAAEETARYFACSTGSVLETLLPKAILQGNQKWISISKEPFKKINHEKYAVQGDDEERFGNYRSRIREDFARKGSVYVVVPTIEDATRSFNLLRKGIEDYAYIVTGALSKKELVAVWEKIHKEKHSVLVVGTSQCLAIPRSDIHSIIVEHEHSRSFRLSRRQHIDFRTFAEIFAGHIGAKYIVGDILLRTETLWRETEGELIESNPFKFRSLSTAEQSLVDMRTYRKGTAAGVKILSDEAELLIRTSKEESEHLFILTTRRGIAPTTLCGDCQNIVTCTHCSAPVVLHRNKVEESRSFFLCHRCGERRSTEEVCKICGSWNLATVGIGIDLVEQKIKDRFPDVKIFRIDADTTSTEKKLTDTIASFYASPGSILLGTEMALSYLHEKIQNSLIVSIDSLFSIPDFRIHEKILYTIIKIRALTSKNFILQTRNPEEKILEYALKGNLIDFYRDEVALRKQFNYPPFVILIKITLEGKREEIVKDMDVIQDQLEPYRLDIFPAFTQTVRGNYVLHALMRIERSVWVDEVLLGKLRSLPQHVSIKVDPESLL